MRLSTILVLAVVCVLALAVVTAAQTNKYGVADIQKITFTGPVWIAGTLLPAGEYEVRHTMQGEDHIMVFQQLNVVKPAEAQVKCTLVPLQKRADRTEKTYTLNDSNQQVLQQLVFRGDTAKLVF